MGALRGHADPLLRWAGGKRWLTSQLIQTIGEVDWRSVGYAEPFVGSGAMLLRVQAETPRGSKPFRRATDINPGCVAALRVIRDNPGLVQEFVTEGLDALNRASVAQRRRDYGDLVGELNDLLQNPSSDWNRLGALMILVNRVCFNGLFRTNRSGKFNVPLGRPPRKDGRYAFDTDRVGLLHRLLKGVQIEVAPYEKELASLVDAPRPTLVYLDPPYASSGGGFVDYHAGSFTWKDQERLAILANQLVDAGHYVISSNGNQPEVAGLYIQPKFSHQSLSRFGTISGSKLGRRKIGELLLVGGSVPCSM